MAVFYAPIRFFLGANTPQGFVGFADELYDPADGWQAYLIKSGPGTGKSSLMRRVYERLTALSIDAEAICCSSDPSSLDGVVFPELKMCLLDATAPHVVEPKFWGAVEQIVPLAICVDETALHARAAEIRQATEANRTLHVRCRKYIHAAASLLRENRRVGVEALDEEKVRRLACRTARQEFGGSTGEGRISHRFLSAITPDGPQVFFETAQALCPRIYTIEDDYGVAATAFLSEIARQAQKAGVDGIACPCPLAPEVGAEHLLFPSIGVGLITSHMFHKVDFPVYRRIHATRFYDAEQLRAKRQVATFNRRAAAELLAQAQALAAEAKSVHDDMERFSIDAMDWDRARAMGDAVLEKFEAAAVRFLATRE